MAKIIKQKNGNDTLIKIAQFIELKMHNSVNMDYIDDGFVSYSDRISPNVKSGDRYNDLSKKIIHLINTLKINTDFGDLINVEHEQSDEWIGFRVTLK